MRPFITSYGCVHIVCVAYTRPDASFTRLGAPEHAYRPYGGAPGRRDRGGPAAEKFRTLKYHNSGVFNFQKVIFGVLETPDTCSRRWYHLYSVSSSSRNHHIHPYYGGAIFRFEPLAVHKVRAHWSRATGVPRRLSWIRGSAGQIQRDSAVIL